MKRGAPVAPFRVVAPGGVQAEPWLEADSGSVLGERVEHWDPDLTLRLDRRVAVDVEAVLGSTGLDSPDGLAVATVWRSDRTRLRGPGMSVSLRGRSGDALVSVSVDVPGHLAGGSVEIRTALVLAEDGGQTVPIVARRPGSILWSDRSSVALEGSAARFPVTVMDFSAVPGLGNDAPWALEWSPRDLDQPVLGAMNLLVNAAVPAVVAAISGGQGPESAAIADMIRFDVARGLIHGALSQEEFSGGSAEFESDSVGRMLRDLLERYWSGVSTETLARRLAETPHRFESELQAKTGLLAR
jgi:hypothetical protein